MHDILSLSAGLKFIHIPHSCTILIFTICVFAPLREVFSYFLNFSLSFINSAHLKCH